ncbi:DsbE family thiol:disulfide interchange protein [Oryzibacter oryziterrae]|uniref:DsbE family thiol:disulfide interchange protein n=1 Tax=Oryzibacter oryziterrae TaxID=2766474 RepID=UPI001F2445B4|nr:DsbE family thiol:disulfide interchange protein [Oryzibacter oryziterrae]
MTDTQPPRRASRLLIALPVVVFGAMAVLFYSRLGAGDPSEIPSVLIGQDVPAFDLKPLAGLTANGDPAPGLKSDDLKTGVTLVNVFASWCVPCRSEHPLLLKLAEDKRIRLVGINYKDTDDQALRFLSALGNPYAAVGIDASGRVGIDWGVYGVPETFVVANGRIVYKHVGPISEDSLATVLKPEIEKALAKPAG